MTKKILFAITMIALVMVGCEKNDQKVNNDPFAPTENPGTQNPETPITGDILTVAQAIANQDGKEHQVKGYIVGWFNTKPNPGECVFTNQATSDTTVNKANMIIADTPDCKDASQVLCVQLPSGSGVRSLTNLGENPDNLGKEVILKGTLTSYNKLPGMKETSFAQIGDNKSTDYDALFYCYRVSIGTLDANTVAAMKVGDTVVLTAKIINYKGNTPETVQKTATLVSINGEIPAGAKTAAECIEIAKGLGADKESTEVYTIAGKVTQITDNSATTTYKNMTFYIR